MVVYIHVESSIRNGLPGSEKSTVRQDSRPEVCPKRLHSDTNSTRVMRKYLRYEWLSVEV